MNNRFCRASHYPSIKNLISDREFSTPTKKHPQNRKREKNQTKEVVTRNRRNYQTGYHEIGFHEVGGCELTRAAAGVGACQ